MEMKMGINGTGDLSKVDSVIRGAAKAEAEGFDSYWVAQIFGIDSLTALAIAGREVPRIELGTAVVPTYPRHPMMLASQALTVQQVVGDRLALGIGLSHQIVVESMWGYSYAKPVRHMRE
ncbi:MAG TPA: LLM class flavin-dependent oxidoreductase, partial [Microthrixaceae bacterium]|nr:LLM class flavin-dependent oxidoreductase [Microthrixaceae bacterium]